MKIVLIDNYDSFTYNLVHYLEAVHCNVTVYRNDEFQLEELEPFDKILLSPGPGIPSEAGLLLDVIRTYAGKKSILGICLGHQAIGEVFGGNLINLDTVHHGIASTITLLDESEPLFKGLKNKIDVGRYHSWVLNPTNFPKQLAITSTDENGQIMSIRHTKFDICGVQFHPESILTPDGKTMLKNWVSL